ncbi:LOW QUALITY PROTEIN: uncharacterized protein EMH_0080840 [Eimeria mitis]|uniref:Tf2-1-like SH3-like domain-containing protein n=1 Tax=Eimeria mitis TaxID=44415 RepID=U6KED7_9EIME|nr:LOW QUALITY PROTEIN: uncharacterized protein EMH_0080840 [Eimeria mitis]CDJ36360.1 hypothetical protein EMH_0080840 [Eimeria mitis]
MRLQHYSAFVYSLLPGVPGLHRNSTRRSASRPRCWKPAPIDCGFLLRHTACSLDLAVGNQPRSTAASYFGTQLVAARECMRKAQEHQARNYDKRRSAVSSNPGDLVLVDSHALCSAQGEQPQKFATRWVGPFAVGSRINAFAYIIDIPPTWRCHHTINLGFLKQFSESLRFPRTLERKPQQRPRERPRLEDTEILEAHINVRRGHRKREYYVKWPGTCDPERVSEDRLREAILPQQLSALVDLAATTPSVCMQAGRGSG